MSDEQNKHIDKVTGHESLMPGQKERLRAAIQILIDYLLEDGHFTHFRHVSPKMKKGGQTGTSTASELSETDSL